MTSAPAETLFDEILEFLAASLTAAELVNFQPPITVEGTQTYGSMSKTYN